MGAAVVVVASFSGPVAILVSVDNYELAALASYVTFEGVGVDAADAHVNGNSSTDNPILGLSEIAIALVGLHDSVAPVDGEIFEGDIVASEVSGAEAFGGTNVIAMVNSDVDGVFVSNAPANDILVTVVGEVCSMACYTVVVLVADASVDGVATPVDAINLNEGAADALVGTHEVVANSVGIDIMVSGFMEADSVVGANMTVHVRGLVEDGISVSVA